jgi:UDP-N-acetylmuramoylalanine--D-glutamate ligase
MPAMIPITTFAGKTVAVFGLARSGIVSAEALRAGGATVACWDDGDAGRAAAEKAGLPLVDLKALSDADWSQFAALVLAPGVPLTHPVPHWTVARAKAAKNGAGVEIIGDIELFFRERAKLCPECPVVCITGTNGKSTTTALIAHVLKSAGRAVQMGGNIGVGVLALEPITADRVYVIEMSSFQIDLTPGLHPTVGLLLNITPDHLDRHGTMENYAAIKAKLVFGSDTAVVGMDDAASQNVFDDIVAHEYATSHRTLLQTMLISGVDGAWADIYYRDGALWSSRPDVRHIELGGIGSLRGAHNGQNAAAAYATCLRLGISKDDVALGFRSFPGLVHRMEELGHLGRATIINDSKGTNADSTEKALASFAGGVFWIAGGVPKEGGIEPLAPLFERVAKAYLVGQCAPEFAATLEGKVPYEISGTLDVALAAAARDAALSTANEPVILLSPACASYDQYKSFEHRGDHFRVLAQALPGFVGPGFVKKGQS